MDANRKERFTREVKYLEKAIPKLERQRDIFSSSYRRVVSITDNDLWEDFQHNAARYYALIEQLGGGNAIEEVGNIPKTLVQQVASYKLDTSLMKSSLRRYQRFGVQYILRQKRTLIGDEMGLGKTVEAIGAMAHLSSEGETHFVVVCPLSVLINWTREIPIHSCLSPISIHGPRRIDSFLSWCDQGGVAVTTYETVSKLPWDRLKANVGIAVVDEAHYIKNPNAKRTQAVSQLLLSRADKATFMSGTPLENRVEEMNELVFHLNPELALSLTSNDTIMNPIAYREEISSLYLRRHRSDVLSELPKLVEKLDWCTLSAADRRDYKDALFSRSFSGMRRVSWRHDNISKSAKAGRLKEICDEAKANGEKVLVFSFFLDTLSKVERLIADDCAGVISGRVPAAKRQLMIDDFSRSNKTVLVSQVTAGGVGLNIQAASIIVFCEPQIKPSMEDQAISRSYRMGQVRTVVVHRLLMDKTVDMRMQDLLANKRHAFANYADISNSGLDSLDVIDSKAVIEIIEAERKAYGIRGGNETASTTSNASDE